ncbi:MAG: D-alanyl-D-alanine carboxypeptidase [Acidobacteria bacterium]|nr:D-alanyl-D-alanine carboxypeptidase [Acidobacteriota bacterium]MCA1642520.1 D-alanyl-D-alanine carboxypeptidase [Acidobacteriota bacterium]
MHSRKPVYALVIVGALITAALTFFPYTLTVVEQASRRVAGAVERRLPGGDVPPPNADAVEPPPATLPRFDVSLWYSSRGEEPEKQGVLVESWDGRQVYASHNADTQFNPASLVKLATTLFALRRLGADHRFETHVYADGAVDPKTKTLQGSLYLVGDDPSFTDYGAVLVAQELKARGIEHVRDRILATPNFSFNFNEKPDVSAKYTADVMKLGQKETGAAEASAGAELFTVYSNPLREILLYMNAHSVNFVADRIGEKLGGPAATVQFLVEELKLPPEEVYLETNSGLYTNRMTPRGIVTVVRALAEEAARHGMKLEDLLAVARCDHGTLRRRMEGTGYECAVVGKTGTLTTTDGGMSNLAGVVYTRDAGTVLFAVLAQGTRIWEHKQMADQLLAEVVRDHAAAPLSEPTAPRRSLLPSASLRAEPQMYTRKIEVEKTEREKAEEDDDAAEAAESAARKEKGKATTAKSASKREEAKRNEPKSKPQSGARVKKAVASKGEKATRRRRR